MIYTLLKPLVAFALRQFFLEIRVKGLQPVETGPVLVVANHPNCGLDPMLVAYAYDRPMWFIAKAALFKAAPVAWFLGEMHLVPIVRATDNPDISREERLRLNRESFAAASGILKKRRPLLIFPEGTSMGDRKLMPIKTGAARIAFQAEEESDFALGLVVQPVGITYSVIHEFRSSATLFFGEPIPLKDFLDRYRETPQEVVRELTGAVEEGIRRVSVEITDTEIAVLTEKVARVYRSGGATLDDEELLRTIATNIELLGPEFPERRAALEHRINSYLELSQSVVLESTKGGEGERLFLWLAAPFVLVGAGMSYLPYRMTGRAVTRLTSDQAWHATLKLGLGTFFFFVWYLLLASLVGAAFGSAAGTLFFLFLTACGVLANRFLDSLRLLVLRSLWPGDSVRMVLSLRDALIADLNELRVR